LFIQTYEGFQGQDGQDGEPSCRTKQITCTSCAPGWHEATKNGCKNSVKGRHQENGKIGNEKQQHNLKHGGTDSVLLQVQTLTDKYNKEVDDLLKLKLKEIQS
jgi:hypothetical protein